MANIIYYMWKPNKEGYIGQDSGFSEKNPARIKDHITHLANHEKDGAATLIGQYGIGGLMYRYYTEDENFGLYETFFDDMAADIGIKNNFDSESKMHIAEIMHIAARRQHNTEFSLSQANKAIGGGKLRIDYSNTPEIQQLSALHVKYGFEIKAGTWYKQGVVNISDMVDLINKPNALHKIYYPKQYAILRLIGFLVEGYLEKIIPDVIIETIGQLIQDKVQKTNSKIFSTTLKKHLNHFIKDINKILGGNNNLSSEWILPSDKIDDMANFIENQVMLALTNQILKKINISEELSSNYSTHHVNKKKWHEIVYITHNDVLMAMGANLNKIPDWFIKGVQSINDAGLPKNIVDENQLKEIANKLFFEPAWNNATQNAISWRVLANEDQKWWVIDSEKYGYLKDRMMREYAEWFAPSASVMQNWNNFYRAMASERSSITQYYFDIDNFLTLVTGRQGDTYMYSQWSSQLLGMAQKYHEHMELIPFGWF